MSKTEAKREYPRLHNGVVLYGPKDEPRRAPAQPASESSEGGAINLNTATAAEISNAISGVGKKTAGDIIAWRKKLDGFESLEQVAEVGGVSVEQLEAADVTV